jgi:hypothetical protein
MRIAQLALALALYAWPALAQPETIFGSGKPPVFKEEEPDRRFSQSKMAFVLNNGPLDPACAQVAGSLLMLLGEAGPYLHRRDDSFYLDGLLVQALNQQLVSQRFVGAPYLIAMVRRVLIDQKLPPEWMKTAEGISAQVPLMDMARLRFLADGPPPIDSFLFTLPVLHERYQVEVKRANSLSAPKAESIFREGYLDKEVTFSGLDLVDVRPIKDNKKKPARRPRKDEEPAPARLLARLTWVAPQPQQQSELDIFRKRKKQVITINAQLAEKQYVDFDRLPKGSRVLVRGRFWDYRKGLTEVDLRNAYLFQEHDWSKGVALTAPQVVSACPMAVNELSGEVARQPSGFGGR